MSESQVSGANKAWGNPVGNDDAASLGIAGEEPVGDRVVPAVAQAVEAEAGVVLLAAVEIVVGRGAGLVDDVAEGVGSAHNGSFGKGLNCCFCNCRCADGWFAHAE